MKCAIEEKGLMGAPLLVCIPGLIGAPSDFDKILEGFEHHFRFLHVTTHVENQNIGLKLLKQNDVKEIDYLFLSTFINNYLEQNYKGKKASFLGLSLGGRVVYQSAIHSPSLFAGGIITDITPGPIQETDLYKQVLSTVNNLNLNLSWSDLKNELNEKITDKNFRVLLKSQLHYPSKSPPAQWRAGIREVSNLLKINSNTELWSGLEGVDSTYAAQGIIIKVFRAARMSGISEEDSLRLQKLKCVELINLNNSSHFLHINETTALREAILTLVAN
jgi:pimeloyl-ACP methyl ester carboxylesterase